MINKFVVPLISASKQKKIGDLARESLHLKKQSQQLLEKAKTRVEQLIEQAAEEK